MDPKETAELIEAAGGSAAFATLIGIDRERYYFQRITNWKRRGLPSAVALAHYDTLQRLRRRAAKNQRV